MSAKLPPNFGLSSDSNSGAVGAPNDGHKTPSAHAVGAPTNGHKTGAASPSAHAVGTNGHKSGLSLSRTRSVLGEGRWSVLRCGRLLIDIALK
ncbi:hypothetical protein M8J77_020570 [Diaphorina citri]|nr:hypothetical protein M8J77_020570 [Diaphorina citri]